MLAAWRSQFRGILGSDTALRGLKSLDDRLRPLKGAMLAAWWSQFRGILV